MRVLLISQYYAPEPALRPCELGASLAARGHHVVAVTGSPCYPYGSIYKGYRAIDVRWDDVDGVRVLRLPVFPDRSRSAIRRAAYYGTLALSASVAAPLLPCRFDVAYVFGSPPTMGLPAVLTKWLRGVPFVLDVQDIWPETLSAAGVTLTPSLKQLMDRALCCLYRQASAITVISPGFERYLIGKGVPADKVHMLPNWANEEVYKPARRSRELARKLGMDGRFNIVFAGTMGLAQSLSSILQAARLLADMPDVQLVLIGEGVERAALEAMASEERLNNVRFLERRPASDMSRIFALADALLIHLKRDPLFAITIPSKTIAYLAAGRPIVAAVEGDAAEVVLRAGAGLACRAQDPIALAACIKRLRGLPKQVRDLMGQRGRRAFRRFYTQRVLIPQFESLLADTCRCKEAT
ncbi:MAG: glycosyltransferase family 4 protein [Anaerolineae bacterium]